MAHYVERLGHLRRAARDTAAPTARALALVLTMSLAGTTAAAPPSAEPADASRSAARLRAETDVAAAIDRGDADAALTVLADGPVQLADSRRLYWTGRALLIKGDHLQARRKLGAALKLRPGDTATRYWLGRAFQVAGAAATASDHFRRAHLDGLDSAELHHHWAEARRDMGQVLGRLVQVPWTDGDAPMPAPGERHGDGIVIGTAPRAADRLIIASDDSAVYRVSEALRRAPDSGHTLMLAGEIWAAADRHEVAIGFFQKAAERLAGPALAACHDAWSRCCLALADADGFLEHARRAMEAAGTVDAERMARCYDRAADEAALRGQLSRQIQFLKIGVETRPAVDRCIRLADALLAAQRPADATTYLRLAEQHNPSREQRSAIAQRLSRTAFLTSPRGKF